MVIHKESDYQKGLNPIVSEARPPGDMRLDFGIIYLPEGMVWEDDSPRERAVLLIKGAMTFHWEGHSREARRLSCFDSPPETLQVPAGMKISLTGGPGGGELAYQACLNDKNFPARYYPPEAVREDVFGGGVLGETSLRTVRTVFDGENTEFSNMVLGEVINHPGKWSSYPPHDHPHPEIYHYRFLPSQGMGVSLLEDQGHIVREGSTSLIPPDKTHSQAAAPGYAMYYLWMIPHLPNNRWLPSTRYFRQEHQWLLEKDAPVWSPVSPKEKSS